MSKSQSSKYEKNERYIVRSFNSEFNLVANFDDDSLPITQFRANNAQPCIDFMSGTSFEADKFKSKYFWKNEFEKNHTDFVFLQT